VLKKIALLGAAVAVSGATVLSATPAQAAGPCNGRYDYACTESSGAFCTLWVDWNCLIGIN